MGFSWGKHLNLLVLLVFCDSLGTELILKNIDCRYYYIESDRFQDENLLLLSEEEDSFVLRLKVYYGNVVERSVSCFGFQG